MLVPETEIIVSKDGAEILRKTVRPGEYVIGREVDCDLHVEVDLVSRRHAQITVNYDHALIEDLGSSNGTFVNGQPVTESTRLWPNQKIQIGAATIELHRIKTVPPPDVSLAPQTIAVQRLLPEEFLRDKKYDIGKIVAQGGMGAILDAKDATTERRVAMKVMLDGSSTEDLTRFVTEAKVTAQLEHPSIVPVYELSVDGNGQVFYTMKMVRGTTLRKVLELLAEGDAETVKKYPLPALLTIFQKVCDALAFAHAKGVIHRDLKPENIMLDDFGVVLVMDWGLAKVLTPGGHRAVDAGERKTEDPTPSIGDTQPPQTGSGTLAGTVMGTPQYMSPEQARGEVGTLDLRSDIYALGAILYHLLAFRRPVAGNDAWDIVAKVAKGEVDPLTAPKNRTIPDSIAAVVRKAMALEREQRYPHVADLQRDIEAYQNGRATRAENASLGKQIVLLVKRHKALFSTAAAAWLIITALAVWFIINVTKAKNQAEVERSHAMVNEKRAETERNRAERALADLNRTAPELLQLAASEAALQHFDRALAAVDTAMAVDPTLAAAYWRRGWLLLAQERLPEAIAALREAQSRDSQNLRFATLMPLVEKMAAAPETARHTPELITPIYDYLAGVGALGESTPLIRDLQQTGNQRLALVKERLEQWLGKAPTGGKTSFEARLDEHGRVRVGINNLRVGTLEPLNGLPIDDLNASGCDLETLEPLRGMRLVHLNLDNNPKLADLNPLRGMPLEMFHLSGCPVSDLGPLAGMPLKYLGVQHCPNIVDLNPLAGAPLEELFIAHCQVYDFSFLRGMTLRKLTLGETAFADTGVLQGMPLEEFILECNHSIDCTPLTSMPLTNLALITASGTDLRPLLHITSLETFATNAQIDKLLPLRDHPSLKFINYRYEGVRPAADFWKEYDTQQEAKKK